MSIVTVKSIYNNATYQYVDNGEPKSGTKKNVYFSPDRKYVVAIFKDKQDFNQKERLRKIISDFLPRIEKNDCGSYFLNEIYRWPIDVIEVNGKTGVIVPIYNPNFFFKIGYSS